MTMPDEEEDVVGSLKVDIVAVQAMRQVEAIISSQDNAFNEGE